MALQPIRVILVDDEKRIRVSLLNILKLHYPQAQVVAEADSVASAREVLSTQQADLVLLDIKLPDGSGFDVLQAFLPLRFRVIFITAFDQFAVQAFKFSAIDYLMKPVIPAELVSALDRVQEQLSAESLDLKLQTLMQNMSQANAPKKIVLNTHETVHVVSVADIVRCEADRNYTRFILAGAKPVFVSGSLIEYEEMLQAHGFFRSHHSHLINLAHVDRYEKKDGGRLIMKDGSEALVSVRRRDELMSALGRI